MNEWDDCPIVSPAKGTILKKGTGRGFTNPAKTNNNYQEDNEFGGRFRESGGGRKFRNDDEKEGGRRFNQNDRNQGKTNRNQNGGDDGDEEPPKPTRVTYVPPDVTEDDTKLYETHIELGINFDKYDNIPVKVTGENVPKPLSTFESSGLREFLLEKLEKCHYTKPTPIQKYAIPAIMAGRDIMGCAQTGSGKTAAFLLPIINVLMRDNDVSGTDENGKCAPQVVIVAPTRELAIQIRDEAIRFTRGSAVKVQIVYGGVEVRYQLRNIYNGCNILVTTAGRLIDFVSREHINFSNVRFVVLDEADKMLDMGFDEDVKKIMSHPSMSPKGARQTLMFSATFPESIQSMAREYLDNYIFIAIGIVGGACDDVEQCFIEVESTGKRKALLELIRDKGDMGGTMIFVSTKRMTDFLASVLSESGISTTSIHGDREQKQREEALNDFKSGRRKILVSTSVASRGLDIPNVRHVINYDLPKEVDEYVHRIGRTGRLGNKGLATSFYDPSTNSDIAEGLIKVLKDAKQEVPPFLKNFDSSSYSVQADSDHFNSFGAVDFRDKKAETIDEFWG